MRVVKNHIMSGIRNGLKVYIRVNGRELFGSNALSPVILSIVKFNRLVFFVLYNFLEDSGNADKLRSEGPVKTLIKRLVQVTLLLSNVLDVLLPHLFLFILQFYCAFQEAIDQVISNEGQLKHLRRLDVHFKDLFEKW